MASSFCLLAFKEQSIRCNLLGSTSEYSLVFILVIIEGIIIEVVGEAYEALEESEAQIEHYYK